MAVKRYGNKELLGDSACPTCVEQGKDRTGNHLQHWRNVETEEEWCYCNRCGRHDKVNDGNRAQFENVRQIREELTPEQLEVVLNEALELPIQALTSRGINLDVAERFGVRVGLSGVDGKTVISHFYPKKKDGVLVAFKIRNLDPKGFHAIGNGSGCDFFGQDQAQRGDVYGGKLFLFEDELSAMSGFQALMSNAKTSYRPACVALPDGSGSIASAVSRNRAFVESFKELVVCMDNDKAGSDAVEVLRKLYPHVKVANIPKGKMKDGVKDVKDPNDMLMDGRILELGNLLRFKAAKESPSASKTISDCIEEALKKPEWGEFAPLI